MSGTVIIEELGERYQKTGKSIVYTSADSVFQVAVHEESLGKRDSFADIGQSIAKHLELPPLKYGAAFI